MKNKKYFVIPESFEILGHTVQVERDNMMLSKEGCVGKSMFETGIIKLTSCPKMDEKADKYGHYISYDYHVATFLHEWIHYALDSMGIQLDESFTHNEKNVNLLAQLMQQFFKTKRGELKP